MDNTDRGSKPDHANGDPRPAAVTFVTTEHFTLQGARSSTISESTGRASVFLGAVSGGLVALGLVATVAKTGVAFYMFGRRAHGRARLSPASKNSATITRTRLLASSPAAESLGARPGPHGSGVGRWAAGRA